MRRTTQAGQAATSKLSNLLGINTAAAPASKSQANFDAAAYLAANPDVAKNAYWSARPWEHYQQHGQNEGRAFTGVAAPVDPSTGPGSADYGSLLKPFGMDDFHLDPGIQFQTQQGNQALMNSQAAKNGTLSGGALKDLIGLQPGHGRHGVSERLRPLHGNKQLTLSSLMGVAGLGQNAAANTGNNSATVSNGIAGTITGAGNASAAGQIGSANAMTVRPNGAATATSCLACWARTATRTQTLGGRSRPRPTLAASTTQA
jgi:hypothetical protein